MLHRTACKFNCLIGEPRSRCWVDACERETMKTVLCTQGLLDFSFDPAAQQPPHLTSVPLQHRLLTDKGLAYTLPDLMATAGALQSGQHLTSSRTCCTQNCASMMQKGGQALIFCNMHQVFPSGNVPPPRNTRRTECDGRCLHLQIHRGKGR